MNSVKENLKKAMKIVKNHWCKGTYDNGNGRYCALGALRKVVGETYGDEYIALSKHVPFGSVVLYNDRSTTHHADIMKLFRKAIRDC